MRAGQGPRPHSTGGTIRGIGQPTHTFTTVHRDYGDPDEPHCRPGCAAARVGQPAPHTLFDATMDLLMDREVDGYTSPYELVGLDWTGGHPYGGGPEVGVLRATFR